MNAVSTLSRAVLAAIIVLAPARPANAQAVPWHRTFGGTGDDVAYGLAPTSDGGFIVAGYTTSYGVGGRDVYLIKTDAAGNLQWEKTYGGAQDDWAAYVQQTTDGGYILVGTTLSFGANGQDLYLIKTDAGGTLQWEKQFSRSTRDYGFCVQQTTDGGYIISGQDFFNIGWSDTDGWVIKTDANGDIQWEKTFGDSYNDWGWYIQQTSDGGYILAGSRHLLFRGDPDARLIKLDADGNTQWSQTYGVAEFESIQPTSDGGYIAAGYTNEGRGYRDAYVVKTEANGNMEWERTLGGQDYDVAKCARQTSDGGYMVAGFAKSFGEEKGDAYLVKLGSDGSTEWEQTFGGAEVEEVYSALQTIDGSFVLAGSTKSFGAGDADVLLVAQTQPVVASGVRTFNHPRSDGWVPGQPTDVSLQVTAVDVATSAIVTEQLPPGWQPTQILDGGVETTPGLILWNIAPLAAGSLTVRYAAVPPASPDLPLAQFVAGNVEEAGGWTTHIANSHERQAGVTILQNGRDGYTGCEDSHICAWWAVRDYNMGGNWLLYVGDPFGTSGGNNGLRDHKKALVKFDLSSLPAASAAQIRGAKLFLYHATGSGEPHHVTAFPLLKHWNQGRGIDYNGEAALGDEVTWNDANTAGVSSRVPWEIAAAMGTTDVGEMESRTYWEGTLREWLGLDVTNSVRAMITGTQPHYGWKVCQDSLRGVPDATGGNEYVQGVFTFLSSEISSVGFRPMLAIYTEPTMSEPVNLTVTNVDAGPGAPVELQPGDPLVLGAFLENTETGNAGPFWLEFWGSRTGGLTLERFLGDSRRYAGLSGGDAVSLADTTPLYDVPDGPYTVVFAVDRPGQVAETNERDNRAVVAGKRVLVFRPPADADLVIEQFTFGPNPVSNGQEIQLGGYVRNIGTEDTGAFWIEFWGSHDHVYPDLHFFLCDSIRVENLAPGEAVDLSQHKRVLYDCPTGLCMAGVYADRFYSVNERDETNNYTFIGGVAFNCPLPAAKTQAGGPDLVVTSAEFAPYSPAKAQAGSPLMVLARVENQGTEEAGPFWVEYWGATLGGLRLTEFLADSDRVAGLAPGEGVDLAFERPLYSLADGPYTVDVVVDRPDDVVEMDEGNNRFAVAGKRLLVVRPQSQANLVIENFGIGPNPTQTGGPITLSGAVRNAGTEHTGHFWIEFWGSHDQDYPNLGVILCDSIFVDDLAPAASVDLSSYSRTAYSWLPPGDCAVFCFADRTDLVNEQNEADNYAILRGWQIDR